MYMEEYERPSPYTLCIMGIFCSFLWGGLLYIFINFIPLSISWSLVCSYIIFIMIIWNGFYILFKHPYCKKKNNIETNESTSLEPPEYVETEIIPPPPPDYNSSIEDLELNIST